MKLTIVIPFLLVVFAHSASAKMLTSVIQAEAKLAANENAIAIQMARDAIINNGCMADFSSDEAEEAFTKRTMDALAIRIKLDPNLRDSAETVLSNAMSEAYAILLIEEVVVFNEKTQIATLTEGCD
ncbi:MAG: hypothetical protein V3V13_11950 [Paracoccaceae bacterium]